MWKWVGIFILMLSPVLRAQVVNPPTSNTGCTGAPCLPLGGGNPTGPIVSSSSIAQVSDEAYPSSVTAPLYGKLDSSNTTPAQIIVIGDSISVGSGASANFLGYSQQVIAAYEQVYGDAGTGFCPASGASLACFPTLSGTWTSANVGPYQTTGTTFSSTQRGTSSATATLGPYNLGDTAVDIIWYCYTDSAAFGVTVNGVSQGSFGSGTCSSFTQEETTITIAAGSNQTVVVTAPSSGALYLQGFNMRNGDGGVQEWQTSVAGAGGEGYGADPNQLIFLSVVPNPAFAIDALGTNDYGTTGNKISTLVGYHQAIYNALHALNIPEVLVIPGVPQSSDSCVSALPTTACPLDYIKADIAWAQGLNIPVVDITARWGTYATGYANSMYATLGNEHPSTQGHTDMQLAWFQRLPHFPATVANGEYLSSIVNTVGQNPGVHAGRTNVTVDIVDGSVSGFGPTANIVKNLTNGSYLRATILGSNLAQITANNGFCLNNGTSGIIYAINSGVNIGNCTGNPGNLFEVGSTNQFQIDTNGLVHLAGTAPSASAGSVTGTNQGGQITGLSTATTTTLTFANSGWTTWASCVANASTSTALPYVSAISKTSVTFTFVSLTGSLYYHCDGN